MRHPATWIAFFSKGIQGPQNFAFDPEKNMLFHLQLAQDVGVERQVRERYANEISALEEEGFELLGTLETQHSFWLTPTAMMFSGKEVTKFRAPFHLDWYHPLLVSADGQTLAHIDLRKIDLGGHVVDDHTGHIQLRASFDAFQTGDIGAFAHWLCRIAENRMRRLAEHHGAGGSGRAGASGGEGAVCGGGDAFGGAEAAGCAAAGGAATFVGPGTDGPGPASACLARTGISGGTRGVAGSTFGAAGASGMSSGLARVCDDGAMAGASGLGDRAGGGGATASRAVGGLSLVAPDCPGTSQAGSVRASRRAAGAPSPRPGPCSTCRTRSASPK